jgi:DNA invertase Pin-like site-specific DNA recombinase
MTKPHILVARAIFPETLERLAQHFEVEANPDDAIWTKAQLIERLQGKVGAFTTGSERIDAEVLAACPQLKIVANMAVGYNNFRRGCHDRRRRAGHQRARRADRDHGRLRLCAADGHGAARDRERAFPARGQMDQVELRHVRRQPRCTAARWASWAWAASARALPSAARTASA